MNEVIRIDTQSVESAPSVVTNPNALLPLPTPGSLGISVRDAVPGDIAFIDKLQKTHNKAVGWMPTAQLEGHIAKGHVLIAEAGVGDSGLAIGGKEATSSIPQSPIATPQPPAQVGYCIGVDKYFKREDTGIIYQMNITPGRQRGLVGATLLKAMFDRWPYGVRLCCCWCAQDLEANHFWEAMGFVPLAFRTGSRKKTSGGEGRVHIFWQKAIRAEDENGQGPNFRGWWYPSQTGSGAIREDRIVLPIPPGTHWSEAKPRILPGVAALIEEAAAERKALSSEPRDKHPGPRRRRREAAQTTRPAQANAGGLWFGDPAPGNGSTPEPRDKHPGPDAEAPKKKRTSGGAKNDPRLVAAARELRDRWMEQVAAEPGLIAETSGGGKYEVTRMIISQPTTPINLPALPDAA